MPLSAEDQAAYLEYLQHGINPYSGPNPLWGDGGAKPTYRDLIASALLAQQSDGGLGDGGVTGGAFGAPGATGSAPSTTTGVTSAPPPSQGNPPPSQGAPPPSQGQTGKAGVEPQGLTPQQVIDMEFNTLATVPDAQINPADLAAAAHTNVGNLTEQALQESYANQNPSNPQGQQYGPPAPDNPFGVPAVEETTTYGVPGFGPTVGGFASNPTVPADNPSFGVPSAPPPTGVPGVPGFGVPYGSPPVAALDNPYAAFAAVDPSVAAPAGVGAPAGTPAASSYAGAGAFGTQGYAGNDPNGPFGGYASPFDSTADAAAAAEAADAEAGAAAAAAAGGVVGGAGAYGDESFGGGYGDESGGGYGDGVADGYGDGVGDGAGGGGGTGDGAGGGGGAGDGAGGGGGDGPGDDDDADDGGGGGDDDDDGE